MAINTRTFYSRMALEFGTQEESENFQTLFVAAVNDALADIEARAFVDTDSITTIDEQIDLDEQYYGVLRYGVKKYLNENKEFCIMDVESADALFQRALGRAQTLYFNDNAPDVRLGDF